MKKLTLKVTSIVLAAAFVLSAASCSLDMNVRYLQPLEYTEFPSRPYDADQVHPVRKPGKLTGEAAAAELDAIEREYIIHDTGDNYVDAKWSFSDLEAAGIKIEKPTFGKVGPGDYKSECEYLTKLLERLYRIDFEKLNKQDRDFYDQIVFDLEEERYIKQYEGFGYMLPAIDYESVGTLYVTLSYLDIRNKKEADMFLELLKDTDRYYDAVCEYEEKRSEKGYASIENFYKQCSTAYYMLTQNSRVEPFRTSVAERIDAVKDMTAAEKASYMVEFEKVLSEVMFPRFLECSKRYSALAKTTQNTKGLAGLPHGKEMYEYMLRKQIGKNCNVDEIGKEMDKVLAMEPAGSNPPPMGDNNREKMEYIEARIAEFFPKIKINYEIVKLPESFKAAGVSGVYAANHYDDPSSEIIMLKDVSNNDFVIFHEGIPGHMYQFNYHKTTLKHKYLLRNYKNTYVEGWATYIMDNPAAMYGKKDAQDLMYNGVNCLSYMILARADILLNYEGLSEGEAVNYLSEITKDKGSMMNLSSQWTDSMLMTPGIAISYGLGSYMTIKTLESIRAIDPRMSILTMHTLYLDAGPGCFDRILASARRDYVKG